MANRKNSHRRRVRVAVLMVLCGAVSPLIFYLFYWVIIVNGFSLPSGRIGSF